MDLTIVKVQAEQTIEACLGGVGRYVELTGCRLLDDVPVLAIDSCPASIVFHPTKDLAAVEAELEIQIGYETQSERVCRHFYGTQLQIQNCGSLPIRALTLCALWNAAQFHIALNSQKTYGFEAILGVFREQQSEGNTAILRCGWNSESTSGFENARTSTLNKLELAEGNGEFLSSLSFRLVDDPEIVDLHSAPVALGQGRPRGIQGIAHPKSIWVQCTRIGERRRERKDRTCCIRHRVGVYA